MVAVADGLTTQVAAGRVVDVTAVAIAARAVPITRPMRRAVMLRAPKVSVQTLHAVTRNPRRDHTAVAIAVVVRAVSALPAAGVAAVREARVAAVAAVVVADLRAAHVRAAVAAAAVRVAVGIRAAAAVSRASRDPEPFRRPFLGVFSKQESARPRASRGSGRCNGLLGNLLRRSFRVRRGLADRLVRGRYRRIPRRVRSRLRSGRRH